MDKRTFLKTTATLGLGGLAALNGWNASAKTETLLPADNGGDDDAFWKEVRKGYDLNPDFINLENGFYCVQPREIMDKYLTHIKEVNRLGAYYMRTVQAENKKAAAKKLADLAGVSSDELIITRNTTESLDMIISGLNWKGGDEAVMATHDYGAMLDMFMQVSERFGIVCKKVVVPYHPQSDEEIVSVYEQAITPQTKLLMVCHMINITGQVLPVKKICDMAHKKGVLVMVDGAHAFAHLQFKISDLGCDFYGCSLHKWLSVPLGAGLLYVKSEHIPKVWPLFAEANHSKSDIARLNHTGTIPVATDLTIPDAIDYYQKIGAERKENRLRYLQQYWTSKVRDLPQVVMYTPKDPHRSGAIANFGIRNTKPADLASYLYKKHNIYTVAIDNNGVQGCRVTPNIFTTTAELDKLVKAIAEIKM